MFLNLKTNVMAVSKRLLSFLCESKDTCLTLKHPPPMILVPLHQNERPQHSMPHLLQYIMVSNVDPFFLKGSFSSQLHQFH